MEMNLPISTEGQTFCQLKKAISATFKRSTPCNLRSALGGTGVEREKESPGAQNLLQSPGVFATMSSI